MIGLGSVWVWYSILGLGSGGLILLLLQWFYGDNVVVLGGYLMFVYCGGVGFCWICLRGSGGWIA